MTFAGDQLRSSRASWGRLGSPTGCVGTGEGREIFYRWPEDKERIIDDAMRDRRTYSCPRRCTIRRPTSHKFLRREVLLARR